MTSDADAPQPAEPVDPAEGTGQADVAASDANAAAPSTPTARTSAPRTPASRAAATRKPAAKSTAAKGAAAKGAAAKGAATARGAAAKTPAAKTTAAKTTAAKTTAAKTTATRGTAAKPPAARRPAAKATPASGSPSASSPGDDSNTAPALIDAEATASDATTETTSTGATAPRATPARGTSTRATSTRSTTARTSAARAGSATARTRKPATTAAAASAPASVPAPASAVAAPDTTVATESAPAPDAAEFDAPEQVAPATPETVSPATPQTAEPESAAPAASPARPARSRAVRPGVGTTAQPSEATEESRPPVEHALEISGLTKSFGSTKAVDGIDLLVPAGSFFGIVGPNGAGKTTTLSMVTGLLRPDSGSVRIHDADVWTNTALAKRSIGVLPDRLRLFDRLTGAELLTYAGALRGLDRKTIRARSADLAAAFGLERSMHRLVSDYSVGMTKKIAIAAAMIHSPRLLVLDEPFESVDPVSASAVIRTLERFVAAGGTVVMSSHSMDLIERVCDSVAIIADGHVLASGPMAEVLGGTTLEDRFVELAGGTTAVEGMEWLQSFSD